MPRMPDTNPDALTAEQRLVHDAIASGPRGQVPAPLWVWLASPEMADIAQRLGGFCRFGTTIPNRLLELAICTLAAHWQAAYEWQAHSALALKAGVAPGVVEALRAGRAPSFEQPDEATVHAFCRELLKDRRVSEETFGRAREVLGERGLAELVGTLGYYTMISMTILAFEVPPLVPGEDPFESSR